jgi:2-dehydro-3-deoxyphosphogluconate aldolase / (4S)-4-hydroxy-2-oxoglutarate aldolase
MHDFSATYNDQPSASLESARIGRGVIAVVRTQSSASALTIARGLASTDVTGIEITMTVPDAPTVISTLVAEGVQRVGAGTIRTVDQVRACIDAGASFLVSPHLDPSLLEAAVARDVPVIPGVLTPSEILRAMALGAAATKLFPVSAMGGIAYVRALLEPLPDARFVVSGEVAVNEVASYLSAGAWAACLGGSLWRAEDVERRDVGAVQAFAERVLARTREVDPHMVRSSSF